MMTENERTQNILVCCVLNGALSKTRELHLIFVATEFGVVLLAHDERAFVASIEIRRLMTSQRLILQKV